MRIEQLDVIRFGLFTDRSLAFPTAERDFHVLVGPNEAGKSTIRSAIHDLLYGIPKNTVHGFLHPMPEMRLGARITHATNTLANTLSFVRTKGNKQTLRTPEDGVLDEGALASFLGATDRAFFTQMFGLDHARLIEGGHSILSASDDLGQILFQSAAGIASLGGVRKALEEEADKLWTPRRAATRGYYMDLDALNEATAALKKATVRTRDWSEAHARLTEMDAAHTQTKEQHKAIQSRRKLLERVRRIQPHLGVLGEVGVQLAELGTVTELAESAAKTLAESEKEMAAATIDLEYSQQQEREALAGIQVDQKQTGAGQRVLAKNTGQPGTPVHPERLQDECRTGQVHPALGRTPAPAADGSQRRKIHTRVR
ncbi:MAG: AAA family ATPase [Rhodoferax sp.]|nr:AAA family ATPase [Rhodoferax sp.]